MCQSQLNQERSKKEKKSFLNRPKYQKLNPTQKKWFEEFEEDSRPWEDLPRSQFNIVKRIFHQKIYRLNTIHIEITMVFIRTGRNC